MVNFVKSFFVPVEMIIWILLFTLLMWYITLNDLRMLSHPHIPETNPAFSWYMILLLYCWIWFANIESFCFYVYQWYWPVISLFRGVFVSFWYQGYADLWKWGWKHSFLFCFFGNNLRRVHINSSLVFGRVHLWTVWSWTFLFGVFKLLIQFHCW